VTIHKIKNKQYKSHRNYENTKEFFRYNNIVGDIIYNEWSNGGIDGSGSYGGDRCSCLAKESEEEPVFSELDKILSLVCPKITYRQYSDIIRPISHFVHRRDYGYYGDITIFGIKFYFLEEIYNAFKKII
jgi:hypothetical protein